jgi:hypothetical protein
MPTSSSYARIVVASVVDFGCLVVFAPHWHQIVRGLSAPHDWVARDGADQAIAQLAGAALWCTALWLGIGMALVLFAGLPGSLGSASRRLAQRLLPVAVLRLLAGAAGIAVLIAPVSASALTDSGGTPSTRALSQVTVSAPIWPSSGPNLQQVELSWPLSNTPADPAAPGSVPSTADAPTVTVTPTVVTTTGTSVVVRPGDSLWMIAAQRLGPGASTHEIAAEWPRWYAANQAGIGTDPSVLVPVSCSAHPTHPTVRPQRPPRRPALTNCTDHTQHRPHQHNREDLR